MSEFYVLKDRDVVPVATLEEWAQRMAGVDRHIAVTEVTPGVIVSTIFLGVDHRHRILGNGSPLLFETMVFNDYGDDGTQMRYSTWEEAEAGHARIVAEQRQRLSA